MSSMIIFIFYIKKNWLFKISDSQRVKLSYLLCENDQWWFLPILQQQKVKKKQGTYHRHGCVISNQAVFCQVIKNVRKCNCV